MRKIALKGKARIEWNKLRGRAAYATRRAVASGKLVDLSTHVVKCTDCNARASVYDHRDYNKPLEVAPVCKGCNVVRGSNAPLLKESINRPSCEKCRSYQVLYRVRKNSFICRVCGNEWKKKEK